MKKFLTIFIPLVILGAMTYHFRGLLPASSLPPFQDLKDNISAIFSKSAPCEKPIPYNLGTFDTQFDVSKSYFLSALVDAEAVWEKPSGLNLFTYAPEDSASNVLKINLIYDYRQQAVSKLASIGIVVEDNKASYDALRAKFTTLKSEYETEKSGFAARVQSFNERQADYQAEVNSWNKKGGGSKAEYDRLQAEGAGLEAEAKKLQAEQTNMNGLVEEINSLVVVLNRLAETLNLSVAQYNTVVSGSLGESFEEGVYQSNGFSREINIYEWSSRAKLVRVLAHEFGHALGLDHVDDPKAIMYKLNQSKSVTLTQADLDALRAKCQIQ